MLGLSIGVLVLLVGTLVGFLRRKINLQAEPDGRIVFDPETRTTYCRVCQQVVSDDQLRCPYCG
jgi:hypothetical protein